MIAGLPKESIDSMIKNQEWLLKNWSDQCIVWQPLHIVKSKENLQAFGENLEKYGYDVIEPPTNDKLNDFLRKSLMPKLKEDTIYWKNKNTNIYEIMDLVSEFRKPKVGLSSWVILSYLKFFDLKYALDVRVSPYEAYLNDSYIEKAKIDIRNYIDNRIKMEFFLIFAGFG